MSLYSCRHFFASHHLAKGRSLAWVAKQMGHSSVPVTLSHYTDNIETGRPGDSLVAELKASARGHSGDKFQPTTPDTARQDPSEVREMPDYARGGPTA